MYLRNTLSPASTNWEKATLYCKGQIQGHKAIDLGVSSKGKRSGVCMPNIKSLSLMVQKLYQMLNLQELDWYVNLQTF